MPPVPTLKENAISEFRKNFDAPPRFWEAIYKLRINEISLLESVVVRRMHQEFERGVKSVVEAAKRTVLKTTEQLVEINRSLQ